MQIHNILVTQHISEQTCHLRVTLFVYVPAYYDDRLPIIISNSI